MDNRKEHVLTILAEFMPLSNQSIDEVLYPEIDAYSTGFLQVSELHTIAWERSGNPDGIPVIVIHGGPGGGSQPSYRRYFNPEIKPFPKFL